MGSLWRLPISDAPVPKSGMPVMEMKIGVASAGQRKAQVVTLLRVEAKLSRART
jgi:hypothetical protein